MRRRLDYLYWFSCRIKLYLSGDECLAHVNTKLHGNEQVLIVQEYIEKPLLLQGYKSHLRLYVLITSVQPLSCYLYGDGVFHLAAEKYVSPAENNTVRGSF